MHAALETCDFSRVRLHCPAYFAESYEMAEFFARGRIGAPIVMECALTFQNPLVVDIGGQSWGGFVLDYDKEERLFEAVVQHAAAGDPEEEAYFREEGITVNFLADYAKTQGYDGLVVYNCLEENGVEETQYGALYPKCIKIEKIHQCYNIGISVDNAIDVVLELE